jgi:hypothetical protein
LLASFKLLALAGSLEETEKILLEIELDRYVSPREIFEAKNLERVMRYINKNNIVNLTIFLVVVHGFFNKSINYGTKQIAEYFSSFYCLMVVI